MRTTRIGDHTRGRDATALSPTLETGVSRNQAPEQHGSAQAGNAGPGRNELDAGEHRPTILRRGADTSALTTRQKRGLHRCGLVEADRFLWAEGWGLARGRVAVMSRGLSDGEAATRVAVYGAGVWGARAGGCGSGLPPQFDDLAGGRGVEDVLGAFLVEDMTCRGGVGSGEGGVSALRGEVFVVGVVTGQPPQFDEVIALADVVDVVRALAPEQVAGWRADRDRGRADAGAVRGQVAGDRIVLAPARSAR